MKDIRMFEEKLEETEPVTEDSEAIIEEPEVPKEPVKAPTNLTALVNDDVTGVYLAWEHEGNTDIVYRVYLNGEFTGALSSNNSILLGDLIAGTTYKAQVSAFNMTRGEESELSNEVVFEVVGLIGDDDPKNWIGVRLDNVTVIYEK